MVRWGAALLALALALLNVVHATEMTNTGFPFEGCKQRMASAGFAARMASYRQWPGGSHVCYKIWATNMTKCNINNKYPRNKTRCCDTMINKFKVWPKTECIGAVRRVTVRSAYETKMREVAYSIQEMDAASVRFYTPPAQRPFYPGSEWVWKVTNLRWNRAQADGARICLELTDPCPHLEDYARDGEKLEWLLYDIKVDDYECCFPGVSRTVHRPFGKLEDFVVPKRDNSGNFLPNPPRPPFSNLIDVNGDD